MRHGIVALMTAQKSAPALITAAALSAALQTTVATVRRALREIGAKRLHIASKITVGIDQDETRAVGLPSELLHQQPHDGRFAGAGIAADLDAAGALVEQDIEIQQIGAVHSHSI